MKQYGTLVLFFGFLFLGCSDDDPQPAPDQTVDLTDDVSGDLDSEESDVDDDATTDPELDDANDAPDLPYGFEPIAHTEPSEDIPATGHDDIKETLDAGEVRAGIVTDWEHGFGGQETDCRPGDFKIYNSVAQFCIAGPTSITSMIYSGGQLTDADFVGESNDRFFMLGPHNDMQLSGADEVRVLDDGRSGTAVVYTRGGEETLKIIEDYVGPILQPNGVTFETEYRLAPDVPYLEIVTWVRPEERGQGILAGDIVFAGDTTFPFFPGLGRHIPSLGDPYPFLSATAEGRSYTVFAESGMENTFLSLEDLLEFPLFPIQLAKGPVPFGLEGNYRRYFILGDGGTDSARRAISEITGDPLPESKLVVTVTEGGSPVAGINLVVSDGEGVPRDVIVSGEDGTVSLEVPDGTYSVVVESWPGGIPEPVVATVDGAGETPVAIELDSPARVTFTAVLEGEGDDIPTPAKVEMFGPAHNLIFLPRGEGEATVVPGTYRVVFSRGEEYSAVALTDVVLEAGSETDLEATIHRTWETDGLISGEFHQHCTRSFDSSVTERDRLLSNIVEGVDFVGPSDHDVITDFTPWLDELDAHDLIYAMPGTEVSPNFVHLNAMPMEYRPLEPSGGAFAFGRKQEDGSVLHLTFPEMVAELRADWGAEAIQVNHPRSSSGFFNAVGYRAIDGPDGVSELEFTPNFDSVEVFNSRGEFCLVAKDWLSLVARGHNITAVGNSDSHGLGSEAGYPRNYLGSDAPSPEDITDDDIVDALIEGDVSVSGGALITYPNGPVIGSTIVPESAGTISLPIRVQTPEWSTVEKLLVVVNGRIVVERDVSAEVEAIIAFDESVEIPVPEDSDSYVVTLVYGTSGMGMVNPGERPFGLANPIFVDSNGTDGWQAPGVSSEDDLLQLEIPWCD